MRLLGGVRLPFLRYRIYPEGARGAIEPRHAGLVHQADPEIAIVVEFEIERSLWVIGLLHWDREIRHLSSLRVEPGKELITEMREPDHAVRVDDNVMGLNLRPRQIVFRDDDTSCASDRTRRDFQIEVTRGFAAEIDAREIVGKALRNGRVDVRPPVLAHQTLRL